MQTNIINLLKTKCYIPILLFLNYNYKIIRTVRIALFYYSVGNNNLIILLVIKLLSYQVIKLSSLVKNKFN